MKKRFFASILFGSALVLGACGGGEEEATDTGNGGETASVDAEQIVNQNCISCHGENLEGRGNFPKLADVGSRLSEEEILGVITNGRGGMPPGIIKGAEAEAVAAWLAEKK
ncbi:cytochrome c551 [Paenisporosarcina cavernae]|uniref:Cytochrome c n=1 Tax=Paenisporosarcina cavernae TaxID=2320858 RepID=A0A385YQG7_9BACL|nr:cytochrome c [Paenisporosarcina cavernae]AYC28975.1 cytochrome c [Paenisporosarcina cavernae]